jgi:superfamily II DNA or RNA helicase
MEGKLTPHGRQEETITAVLNEPTRAALIADEPGAGKTLVAVEIALRAGWTRALFIGIGDTFPQWKERFELQSGGAATMCQMESKTKAGKQAYADFLAGEDGFYFATIQWLQAQDFEYRDKTDANGNPIEKVDKKTGVPTGKFQRESKQLMIFKKMCDRKRGGLDAVVFDESHIVSNHNSVGRKVLTKFHGGQHNERMWKIALSATWSGNSFENAWSAPNWLWPDLVMPYWIWRQEWCATEDVYVPGKPKPVSQVTGEKEPGKWVKSLPLYRRWESDLKPPKPIKIYVDPTEVQRQQMEDLKRDLMTWVDTQTSAGVVPLVVDVPGALYSRCKQLALAEITVSADGEKVTFPPYADSAKLRVLRGILDKFGDQPVVLLTDSEIFARLTAERMQSAGYNAVAYTGKTSKKRRKEIKQAFMAGEIQYLVLTVQTAGTGLDGLQTVASKIVWLNLPDGDPKLEEQGRGRVFRQGMTKAHGEYAEVVLIQRDSADEKILEGLVAQAASLQASFGAHNLAA